MNNTVCGFIGLGLIGGSIARALKEGAPDTKIIAYDPNDDSLALAKEEGIADITVNQIDASFTDCNYIFLCAPVEINDQNLLLLKPFLNSGTTLTDIGSVKTDIHLHIHELGLDEQFIGGHPMTGTERVGFQNSKAQLLENAYYILTKTSLTSEKRLDDYYNLVKIMGALPLIVSYEQHDYITAAISHLPHVISACLVNLIRESDSPDGLMKMIAAGGFKDITRISSSSPVMWQQICLTNRENISALLSEYISALSNMRTAIDEQDSNTLYNLFDSARKYRDSFIDVSSGPIKKVYALHVDIADQPGMLAAVATLLAVHYINIRNIGIVHNREYERGTLRIEFHEEKDIFVASELLKSHGYVIS